MSLRPDLLAQASALLENMAFLRGASITQQAAIASMLEFKAMVAGKVAILEQEISKTLYILAKGSVGIWRRKNNQKERLALLRAPTYFGEVSMFADVPATALVKTEEDSQFFMLSRDAFEVLVSKDPALGALIQKNIETLKAERLQAPTPPNPA